MIQTIEQNNDNLTLLKEICNREYKNVKSRIEHPLSFNKRIFSKRKKITNKWLKEALIMYSKIDKEIKYKGNKWKMNLENGLTTKEEQRNSIPIRIKTYNTKKKKQTKKKHQSQNGTK